MRLVVGSRNAHKLRELRALLPGHELVPVPAGVELGPETGTTFAENAALKARRAAAATGAPSDMARALRAYNNSARYVRAITHYAEQMVADERAYLGYHAWQVYYGTRLLPAGAVID